MRNASLIVKNTNEIRRSGHMEVLVSLTGCARGHGSPGASDAGSAIQSRASMIGSRSSHSAGQAMVLKIVVRPWMAAMPLGGRPALWPSVCEDAVIGIVARAKFGVPENE